MRTDKMSDAEVLTKCIERAIENGWDMMGYRSDKFKPSWCVVSAGQMPTPKVVEDWVPKNSLLIQNIDIDVYVPWYELVFDHSFAKALWGNLPKRSSDMYDCPADEIGQVDVDNWEHHLQQLAISEDRVQYLREWLEGQNV